MKKKAEEHHPYAACAPSLVKLNTAGLLRKGGKRETRGRKKLRGGVEGGTVTKGKRLSSVGSREKKKEKIVNEKKKRC